MKNKKALIFFLILVNVYLFSHLLGSTKTTFYFPDVGNADACIIKTSHNQVILIDAGKDKKILNFIGKELPFWKREIDLLILSHAHNDHYGGIADILKRYKVKHFVWNGLPSSADQFRSVLDEIESSGAQMTVIFEGVLININSYEQIETYWPPQKGSNKDLNNSSLIQKYLIGQKGVGLFTGDVSAEILNGVNYNIDSIVLKVPHHGSKYGLNQKAINDITPDFAVIPSGKNSYGHPSKEILNLLEKNKILTFNTKDGPVKISCLIESYCYN